MLPSPAALSLPFASLLLASVAIDPGQAEQLMALTGGSNSLGDCECSEVQIDRDHANVTYLCGGDHHAVVLSLWHPEGVEAPAARTEKFALRVEKAGPESPALVAALAARVRANESTWSWRDVKTLHWAKREAPPRRMGYFVPTALFLSLAGFAFRQFNRVRGRGGRGS